MRYIIIDYKQSCTLLLQYECWSGGRRRYFCRLSPVRGRDILVRIRLASCRLMRGGVVCRESTESVCSLDTFLSRHSNSTVGRFESTQAVIHCEHIL
jgi:hypothetical protein